MSHIIEEHPHLEMDDHFHARHAHKYVVIYVFIVLLLLLTGGIYTWQHKKVKQLTANVTTLQSQTVNLQKQLAGTLEAQKQKVITPDGTWKTFCSVVYGECFQFPGTWTATTTGASTVVSNPAHTVQAVYTNPAVAGKPAPLHASLVTPITKNPDLKVLGGYYTDAAPYTPFFGIINSTQKVSINHTLPNTDVSTFTDKNKRTVHLWASTVDGFNGTAKAENWLTSTDGKIAQAIVQSFYYK